MKSAKVVVSLLTILLLGNMGCTKTYMKEVRCELEPDPGPCLAHIPKYYFDAEEGMCKEFIWGGCRGVVPFETLEDCEECQ